MYGTSVANIRAIRRTAQHDHPARNRVIDTVPGMSEEQWNEATEAGTVTPDVVEGAPVLPIGHEHDIPRHDLAHLRTEGGVELPTVLS
jgi:hypothetical protein